MSSRASEGAFLVDLHVHTRLSGDNVAEPEECIEWAIRHGLHGLAFTEHYSYEASEEIEPLAERYRDRIQVLRGVEFSTIEGHCLVFGVNTDRLIGAYAPVKELIREVGAAGGVVVPSHPYRAGSGLGELTRSCAGIVALEGLNGCNNDDQNRQAISLALRMGLPCTGGSDAHEPRHVGAYCTAFTEPATAENLAGLLRVGCFTAGYVHGGSFVAGVRPGRSASLLRGVGYRA